MSEFTLLLVLEDLPYKDGTAAGSVVGKKREKDKNVKNVVLAVIPLNSYYSTAGLTWHPLRHSPSDAHMFSLFM